MALPAIFRILLELSLLISDCLYDTLLPDTFNFNHKRTGNR